jgi:uncharacterized cupredoxin-like copper-binding protein
LIGAAGLALLAGACGGSGDSAAPARHINVDMRDVAFAPTAIAVKDGELVELRFHNRDSVTHDAFVGNAKAQRAHEASMHSGRDMSHHGMGGDAAVTVKPGATGTLRYRFHRGDTVLVGCHQPGHYASGMHMAVTVS